MGCSSLVVVFLDDDDGGGGGGGGDDDDDDAMARARSGLVASCCQPFQRLFNSKTKRQSNTPLVTCV